MFKNADFVDQKRISFNPFLKALLLAGLVLFSLNVFKWSTLNEDIKEKKDKIAEVEKFNNSLNKKVQDIPSISISNSDLVWLNNLNLISTGLGFNWNLIYSSLEKRVPKNVTLTSVSIDLKGLKVSLMGRAQSFSEIGTLTLNLNESKIFKNIELTKISASKQDFSIFQLSMDLVGDSPLLFNPDTIPSKAPAEGPLKKVSKSSTFNSKIAKHESVAPSTDVPALVPEPVLQGGSFK